MWHGNMWASVRVRVTFSRVRRVRVSRVSVNRVRVMLRVSRVDRVRVNRVRVSRVRFMISRVRVSRVCRVRLVSRVKQLQRGP